MKKTNVKSFIGKITGLFIIMQITVSCAVKIPAQVRNISEQDAHNIMNAEVGTATPQRKLYHTYEEDYSLTTDDQQWMNKNTLSFSKIEGNYVEGVLISVDGRTNVSLPVFGRYNFNHLYIYTQGSTPNYNLQVGLTPVAVKPQEIFVFEIGQNGRQLTRKKFAYKIENNIIKWENEPPYNIDIYPNDKNYEKIFSSTGFISKTDDYIGEDSKAVSNGGSQTLSQKLKELKKLYDDQLITEEEYNKARKKALLEK